MKYENVLDIAGGETLGYESRDTAGPAPLLSERLSQSRVDQGGLARPGFSVQQDDGISKNKIF